MDGAPPDGAVVVALLRDGQEVRMKRLFMEGNGVRPENGDHEELVLPAEEVWSQGRVVYVVPPPGKRA
jgi:repressor LexA